MGSCLTNLYPLSCRLRMRFQSVVSASVWSTRSFRDLMVLRMAPRIALPLTRIARTIRPLPTQSGERLVPLRRRVGKTVRFELVAQRGLQDLARRGVGNAVDEHDVIRHPPFGDLAFHVFQDVFARRAMALLELPDQQRTLVPFGMMDADHGGLRDRGMSDREVFQIDRRNPFAAGFDH